MVGRMRFDRWRRGLAVALLMLPGPLLAAVSAEVDKNPVLEGESLTLTVTVSGGADGEPNFSVLEPDFRILDRGQSSQFRIMNGQTSRQTQFTVTLLPQRRGEIAIPSIVVGSERTRPILLTVQKAEPGGDNAPAAFIEFEADKDRVHVREQVLLTARLYVRGQLVSGNLSEPAADGAVVESLGEQSEHQELRGRHRYRVIERRYALFPEQSGRLNLQAPVFSGEISDGGAEPSLFGMRPRTRRIHASGEPLDLSVEPRPADYPGDVWLPAGKVQLRQQIEPAGGPWVAGEPLTRTVIVEVDGQLHTQLPELTLPGPPGTPSYAEAPEQQTAGNASGVTAVSRHPMAIIPSAAGELTLPEIRITWWDVAADRPREAVLEARTLPIQAASGATPAPTSAPPPPGLAPAATPTSSDSSRRLWQILAITALAGWLGTLAAWWWQSRPKRARSPVAIEDHGPLLATLRRAEPAHCRQALLRFAAETLDGEASLEALAQRAGDPDFARALASLDGALYGAETGEWPRADREAVIRRIRAWPSGEKSGRRHDLPPLYPE